MKGSPLFEAKVHLPLEVLANLIYLAKQHASDAARVENYMNDAEKALSNLVIALAEMPDNDQSVK